MIAATVIGHRGAAGIAPENTLAAVRAAADLGVRWIEVDAQLCMDGRAVVYHDATLERCTNGAGRLADYDYAALSRLDAGSHFDPRFAGERVPLLRDLLRLCCEHGIGVNLELKVAKGRDPEALAAQALRELAAHGPAPARVLVSSFDEAALVACRARDANVQLGLICETCPDDLAATHDRLQLATLHCDWQTLERHDVERTQALGLEVYAWTVNQPDQAQTLWDWGVSGVITDCPQLFVER